MGSCSSINKKQIQNISRVSADKNDPRWRTSFIYQEILLYDESCSIEYKNYYWPFGFEQATEIKKQICGFLNSKGGRIYIGVKDDKKVYGIQLNSQERDVLKRNITNYTADFHPEVRTAGYINIYFIPIRHHDRGWKKDFWVIKIIVKQGNPRELYSISTSDFKAYIRLDGQKIELDTKLITFHLANRSKEKKSNLSLPVNHFEDPLPEIPEIDKNFYDIDKAKINIYDMKDNGEEQYKYKKISKNDKINDEKPKNKINEKDENSEISRVLVSGFPNNYDTPERILSIFLLKFRNLKSKLLDTNPVIFMKDEHGIFNGNVLINFIDSNFGKIKFFLKINTIL